MTDKKSKTSKLAIASLVIPCISIIGSTCFVFAIQHCQNIPYSPLYIIILVALLLLFVLPFLPFLSFIIGIWSLVMIKMSHGLLKGYIFALLGIIISAPALVVTSYAYDCKQNESRLILCQQWMIELHKALVVYGKSHNDLYPAASNWCDLLITEKPNIKGWFLCPESKNINREPPYKCSYAINPNAEPNSAPDVVLLFETKDGWNQFGGPELMSFDNHYRKGCNVLFNDGSTKFILPKQKGKLKWSTTAP